MSKQFFFFLTPSEKLYFSTFFLALLLETEFVFVGGEITSWKSLRVFFGLDIIQMSLVLE